MIHPVAHYFDDPDGGELAARTRQTVQAEPVEIARIAAEIGRRRGERPRPSVTRACREEIWALSCLEPVLPGSSEATARQVLRRELEECLLTRDVDEALQWLREIGAIAVIFPELEATIDLAQEAGRRHKDVWEHTKLVVKQSVRRPVVRWAALFHDIGKVPTRTFTHNGVHFHGHAEVGARMFDKINRRFPFEPEARRKIRFLIKHHLRSNQYSEGWTDGAVRRFDREMGEHLTDLLDLSRADITSRRPGRRRALLHQITALAQRVETLRDLDARLPPLPTGLGNTIMAHFGLPPSRLVGDIKSALESAVERGELLERQDDDYYIDWIGRQGLVDTLKAAHEQRGSDRHRPPAAETAAASDAQRSRAAS
jgi:poly(A) polymerase